MQIPKPGPAEYFSYYEGYINLVPSANLPEELHRQLVEVNTLLVRLPEGAAEKAYEEGKWTVKEVVGHLTDTERIMTYRLLCLSRGEQISLPGFDQDAYVAQANFNQRRLADLLNEHRTVRQATISLLQGLRPKELTRTGTVNAGLLSVRALAYIIAGHELHHLHILRTRYLNEAV